MSSSTITFDLQFPTILLCSGHNISPLLLNTLLILLFLFQFYISTPISHRLSIDIGISVQLIMSQQPQYYKVSRVWFSVGESMRDPHVPDNPQFHHAIFVETQTSGYGWLHNAVGDVTSHGGMCYERKQQDDIMESDTYYNHQVLGYVAASSYPQLEARLQSCQTPPQQKAYNAQRNATEPFKTANPLVFYTADELRNFQFPRLRKCKWWVEDQAIPALQGSQLLVQSPPAH
jgi:hypothetical protein